MEFFEGLASSANMVIFGKLALAIVFGTAIGLERVFAHRSAGPRTYALVAMSSALFIIISEIVSHQYLVSSGVNPDPLKIASNIIVGVGFLGTGIIIVKDSTLIGLTTAAGMWAAAGIGMATGFGLYDVAFLGTVFTLFIFTILWYLEHSLLKMHDGKNHPDR